jgi:Kef-type K+ transport system membrane component KefB
MPDPTSILGALPVPVVQEPDVESLLLTVMVQLAVIIFVARLFALLFRRLGQPAVVGEIAAGLILGPSVLGKLAPGMSEMIFVTSARPALQILSQIGLIFLLFLIGLECDFSHIRARGRAAISISIIGIALPFALGWGLAQLLYPHLDVPDDWVTLDPRSFALFMGTAMSITAIPVLARILMELNIAGTRIGTVTITAAAADDAMGWTILASVAAMVRAKFDLLSSVRMIAMTIGFAIFMVYGARPMLRRWFQSAARPNGDLDLTSLAILFVILFLCSIATHLIGIFAIFGAFLLGAVLSDVTALRDAVTRQMRNFVTVFFLPVFFTHTGLNTDIGTLTSAELWLFAIAVSVVATVGKLGGCSAAAWLGGFSPRESACIGMMMNTRGLMELIVVNVGLQLHVIPPSVYCMLVIMALVTTVMTTPILRQLGRGTELEPFIMRSSVGAGGHEDLNPAA